MAERTLCLSRGETWWWVEHDGQGAIEAAKRTGWLINGRTKERTSWPADTDAAVVMKALQTANPDAAVQIEISSMIPRGKKAPARFAHVEQQGIGRTRRRPTTLRDGIDRSNAANGID